MNYEELVLSKSPSAYISYNLNNQNDNIGTLSSTRITVDFNPSFDYVEKKHGIRSKKIGHAGTGMYDSRRFDLENRYSYVHGECWVYIPTTTLTDSIELMYWGSSYTGTTFDSHVRVLTTRHVRFSTQSGDAGLFDNNLNSLTQIPFNTWTHVAWQFINGIKNIYINGILDSTITVSSHNLARYIWEGSYAFQTCYIDEWAFWTGSNSSVIPSSSDILQRVNFPSTKTKWWDSSTSQWVRSGDEKYWNGSSWISMQDKTYKHWNGSSWVTL